MRKSTVKWLVVVAATATVSTAQAAPNPDPAEKFNRGSFAVHQFLDRILFRPLAMAYVHVTPKIVRVGVENVLRNLGEPVVLVNDTLQGHFRKAGRTTARFFVNSTIGIAGLVDVATPSGLPHHDNGFALTLGRGGVKSGPYLFIPLLGPSTVRDTIGGVVDGLTNPFHWVFGPGSSEYVEGSTVIGGLDARANADDQLKSLFADATDPYATLRSVYLQSQQAKIDDSGAGGSAAPQLPDFDDAPPTSPAPAAPKQPAGPQSSVQPPPSQEAPAVEPAQTSAAEPLADQPVAATAGAIVLS